MDVRDGFLDAIGNTPLIRLQRAPPRRPAARSSARRSSSTPAARSRTGPRSSSSATPRRAGRCGRAGSSSRAPPATPASVWRWSATRGATAPSSSFPTRRARRRRTCCGCAAPRCVAVPAVPYRDPNNYVKVSGRLAEELARTEPNGAIWANQFDNVANRARPLRDDRPGNLAADRRQGRRLRLRRRHRRHARRRRHVPQGAQPGRGRSASPIRWARRSTATTRPAS